MTDAALVSTSLKASLGRFELKNPVVLASGVVGVTVASLRRAIESGAGGAVSKSIGLEPREGYVNPTVVATDCGLLNAVGLSNPGARAFSEELARSRGEKLPIIVSIFGGGPAEFSRVVEILNGNEFLAYELNLSCPHVEGVGTEIGHDPEVVASVVKAVRSKTSKPVFAKLSPNTHRLVDVAKAAVDSGADGLTAINTLSAMTIDTETFRPILTHKKGGLSGEAIRPVAIRCVLRPLRESEGSDNGLWRCLQLGARGRVPSGGCFGCSGRNGNVCGVRGSGKDNEGS